MVNLKNVKMVIFSFTDTICICKSYLKYDSEEYWSAIYDKSDFWTTINCMPNMQIKKFMDICSESNIHMGLISASVSGRQINERNSWVYKNYGYVLEDFCVSSADDVNRALHAASKMYHLFPEEILFVDYLTINLEDAEKEGYQVCSPMEVVNYINALEENKHGN